VAGRVDVKLAEIAALQRCEAGDSPVDQCDQPGLTRAELLQVFCGIERRLDARQLLVVPSLAPAEPRERAMGDALDRRQVIAAGPPDDHLLVLLFAHCLSTPSLQAMTRSQGLASVLRR
jgi:hypothetical protein